MFRNNRIVSWVTVFLLVAAVLLTPLSSRHADAADPQPAALNGNPGFESGSLDPWTSQNDAKVMTDPVHSGQYAVDLGSAYSGVQQTVEGLKPNTAYTLTAWVQTSSDLIYLGAKNFAGSGSEVNTTTTSAEYTKLSVSFTTDSATTSAYIFLWKNDNAGASYADDIVLSETPVQTYSGSQVGFNTQDPYFQTPDSLNKLYDQVTASGVKWVRATLFWDLMEPTKGQMDWKQADMIFDTIKAKGLNYDLVIRSAPSWAADGADTSLHNYAPTDAAAFENISYLIAKRYLNRGVQITFEIGNEENMQFFNMPEVDPAAYTHNMLIPAAKGIRSAAAQLGVPAPEVLVGGFAPVEPLYVPNSVAPLDFMQAVYDNGGQGYFDSIAYHPYTYVSAPTPSHWTFTELTSLVDLMNSKGDTNRKIWATEAGYATGAGEGEVSEADQASFTAQLFDLWFSLPYAGPMLWYELVDNSSYDSNNRENTFGFLHSDDIWSTKPAYDTLLSKITREEVPAAGISLNALSLKLEAGAAGIQLSAALSPATATGQKIVWRSSKPDVAAVSDTGFVTPLKPGSATIMAETADGSVQASTKVSVVAANGPHDGK